jgi:hypothetical protein
MADILAGEAPDEDIDTSDAHVFRPVFRFPSSFRVPFTSLPVGVGQSMYRPHILVARHPRPVLR